MHLHNITPGGFWRYYHLRTSPTLIWLWRREKCKGFEAEPIQEEGKIIATSVDYMVCVCVVGQSMACSIKVQSLYC